MTNKVLLSAIAVSLAAALSAPGDASANGKKQYKQAPAETRDCKPYNGPFGYYGNPWCDGGYKFAEDYAPGSGRYFDVFELPQVRRLGRRWE